MNFSAYSIKNPLVAILLFTLLMLGGTVAFKEMKVQQFPDIDLPAVITTVTMQGAAPSSLENEVAKKIENKLASIEGIKHLRTTIQTGAVTVHSEFKLEKPIAEALDDVRSAVAEVRGDLPSSADEPIVAKVSTAGFPVVGYSVSSKTMSEGQLSWWVDDTLSKRLSNLAGVGQISRIGGIERQIIVNPDIELLNGWQLPITSLANQVAGLWNEPSGGESKIGDGIQTIRVLGSGRHLGELENLTMTTPTGGTTTLSQIAHITDDKADVTSTAILDNQSVVAFRVTRSRGASEVAMVKAIDDEINQMMAQNPTIHITKIYDHAKPIESDYQASLKMLIEGCVLAVVVVLVFLRNWRATFVTATALPLSIIPTFLAMYLFGFSLNLISLLALSLVIGVLVDDAIVEVENIMRHLHLGKTPMQAALEAADEIGLAVVATTFTLIAVFLPTAFMSGVVGQFFRQFGWTASIAIFISLLVARLVTPMMAAYILKPEKPHKETVGAVMRGYLGLVNWTLRNRTITIVATILLFVGSLSLAKQLPSAFIPDNDTNQTQVQIELTPDATLDDTKKVAEIASQKIGELDGVVSVFAAIGSAGGGMDSRSASAGSVNNATIDVTLAMRGMRVSKTELETQIRQKMSEVAGARFKVGLSSGGEAGYSFSLTSDNPDKLMDITEKTLNDIKRLGNVTVTSNKPLPKPELTVIPDRLAMADKGVSSHDLATVLRVATLGDYEAVLPKLTLDTRQLPIVVKLDNASRANLAVLNGLYVPSTKGLIVKVGDVAQLKIATGDSEIRRLDRERAIKITVESPMPLGELIDRVKAVPTLAKLPEGIGVVEEGQAESMNELFSGFVLAMGVGILCIFGVLMLLFHRVLQPFTILMALPLSIGGALIGLIVTNSSLSMPSMIGFIMLMGIATKNSILLVDYAIIAVNQGMERYEAIMDACQKRARPIIMTTIAMGAGMLPLVIDMGGTDPTFRQPMAAAVLGGLITSTFLSLVVVPVVYTLMDDMGNWFGKLRVAK